MFRYPGFRYLGKWDSGTKRITFSIDVYISKKYEEAIIILKCCTSVLVDIF